MNCLVIMSFRIEESVKKNQKEIEKHIDVCYLRSFKENKLYLALNKLLDITDYDNYILASDDMIINTLSLNTVIKGLETYNIFTGYCNLINYNDTLNNGFSFIKTFGLNGINISRKKLTLNNSYNYDNMSNKNPYMSDYYFIDKTEIDKYFPDKTEDGYFEVPNTGLTLFGMRKELWKKYSINTYKSGVASDHYISLLLNRDNEKIYTHKDAFCLHLKSPNFNKKAETYPEWHSNKGSIILVKDSGKTSNIIKIHNI